jgi:hypothetical protein
MIDRELYLQRLREIHVGHGMFAASNIAQASRHVIDMNLLDMGFIEWESGYKLTARGLGELAADELERDPSERVVFKDGDLKISLLIKGFEVDE